MIYPTPLTLRLAADLAPWIRKADLDDLKRHDLGIDYALATALVTPGEAWAVMHKQGPNSPSELIGAGGWTCEGVVWTLWADLSRGQARDVLRMAVPYARILSIRAKQPLYNFYRADNAATEHFLKATGCVDFLDEVSYRGMNGESRWKKFKLKRLEDMPDV